MIFNTITILILNCISISTTLFILINYLIFDFRFYYEFKREFLTLDLFVLISYRWIFIRGHLYECVLMDNDLPHNL